MAKLIDSSRRILVADSDTAYRCACDAVAIIGEIEVIKDQKGLTIAFQAVRPAPELLPVDKRHYTPPGIAEWEYYWIDSQHS